MKKEIIRVKPLGLEWFEQKIVTVFSLISYKKRLNDFEECFWDEKMLCSWEHASWKSEPRYRNVYLEPRDIV